jgi:hypothetical protein
MNNKNINFTLNGIGYYEFILEVGYGNSTIAKQTIGFTNYLEPEINNFTIQQPTIGSKTLSWSLDVDNIYYGVTSIEIFANKVGGAEYSKVNKVISNSYDLSGELSVDSFAEYEFYCVVNNTSEWTCISDTVSLNVQDNQIEDGISIDIFTVAQVAVGSSEAIVSWSGTGLIGCNYQIIVDGFIKSSGGIGLNSSEKTISLNYFKTYTINLIITNGDQQISKSTSIVMKDVTITNTNYINPKIIHIDHRASTLYVTAQYDISDNIINRLHIKLNTDSDDKWMNVSYQKGNLLGYSGMWTFDDNTVFGSKYDIKITNKYKRKGMN